MTGISGPQQAPGWAIAAIPRPPGALGSPFVLLLACLAAAHGPGRPGLRRYRQVV